MFFDIMANKVLEATLGKAEDFTDKQKQVMRLADFKDVCADIVKWKETTNTQKQQLRKIFSDLQLKLNQTSAF